MSTGLLANIWIILSSAGFGASAASAATFLEKVRGLGEKLQRVPLCSQQRVLCPLAPAQSPAGGAPGSPSLAGVEGGSKARTPVGRVRLHRDLRQARLPLSGSAGDSEVPSPDEAGHMGEPARPPRNRCSVISAHPNVIFFWGSVEPHSPMCAVTQQNTSSPPSRLPSLWQPLPHSRLYRSLPSAHTESSGMTRIHTQGAVLS